MSYDWKPEDSDLCARVSRLILETVDDDIERAGAVHGALASSLIAMAIEMGRPDAAARFQEGFRAGGEIGRQMVAETAPVLLDGEEKPS